MSFLPSSPFEYVERAATGCGWRMTVWRGRVRKKVLFNLSLTLFSSEFWKLENSMTATSWIMHTFLFVSPVVAYHVPIQPPIIIINNNIRAMLMDSTQFLWNWMFPSLRKASVRNSESLPSMLNESYDRNPSSAAEKEREKKNCALFTRNFVVVLNLVSNIVILSVHRFTPCIRCMAQTISEIKLRPDLGPNALKH